VNGAGTSRYALGEGNRLGQQRRYCGITNENRVQSKQVFLSMDGVYEGLQNKSTFLIFKSGYDANHSNNIKDLRTIYTGRLFLHATAKCLLPLICMFRGSGKCRHVHGIVFISDTVSDEEGKHLCGDASHRISSSMYLAEYPSYDTLASASRPRSIDCRFLSTSTIVV